MNVNTNLAALRKEKKLTQKELALNAGISSVTISRLENLKAGESVRTDYIIKLAKYFDVSVDYLLGLSPCKNADNAKINEVTGLSEKSINNLRDYYSKKRHPGNTAFDMINLIDTLLYYKDSSLAFAINNLIIAPPATSLSPETIFYERLCIAEIYIKLLNVIEKTRKLPEYKELQANTAIMLNEIYKKRSVK